MEDTTSSSFRPCKQGTCGSLAIQLGQHDSTAVVHISQLLQQVRMTEQQPQSGGNSVGNNRQEGAATKPQATGQQEDPRALCCWHGSTAGTSSTCGCCQRCTQSQQLSSPLLLQEGQSQAAPHMEQHILHDQLTALSQHAWTAKQLQHATQRLTDLLGQAAAAGQARALLAAELECGSTERDMLTYDLKSVTQRISFLEDELAQQQAGATRTPQMPQHGQCAADGMPTPFKLESMQRRQQQQHQQEQLSPEALAAELQLLLGARQEQAELQAGLFASELTDVTLRDQLSMATMREAALTQQAGEEQAHCAALQQQLISCCS